MPRQKKKCVAVDEGEMNEVQEDHYGFHKLRKLNERNTFSMKEIQEGHDGYDKLRKPNELWDEFWRCCVCDEAFKFGDCHCHKADCSLCQPRKCCVCDEAFKFGDCHCHKADCSKCQPKCKPMDCKAAISTDSTTEATQPIESEPPATDSPDTNFNVPDPK